MSTLFHALKPDDAYYPFWAELRRRRLAYWVGFLLWGPAVAPLAVLFWPSVGPLWAIPLALAPCFSAFIGVTLWRLWWACPRCRRPYYDTRDWWFSRASAHRCFHCGLTEYAPNGQY